MLFNKFSITFKFSSLLAISFQVLLWIPPSGEHWGSLHYTAWTVCWLWNLRNSLVKFAFLLSLNTWEAAMTVNRILFFPLPLGQYQHSVSSFTAQYLLPWEGCRVNLFHGISIAKTAEVASQRVNPFCRQESSLRSALWHRWLFRSM